MANIAIYYKLSQVEEAEQAISCIEKMISKIETRYNIVGVFIDSFNESVKLMELLDTNLSNTDFILMNKYLNNEFDQTVLDQLSKSEKFKILFFSEFFEI